MKKRVMGDYAMVATSSYYKLSLKKLLGEIPYGRVEGLEKKVGRSELIL